MNNIIQVGKYKFSIEFDCDDKKPEYYAYCSEFDIELNGFTHDLESIREDILELLYEDYNFDGTHLNQWEKVKREYLPNPYTLDSGVHLKNKYEEPNFKNSTFGVVFVWMGYYDADFKKSYKPYIVNRHN